MRKLAVLIMAVVILSGCAGTEVFETVTDSQLEAEAVEPAEIRLDLPEESVLPAMESENGKLYLCGDYDVLVQTLPAGDLDATIRTVSGYGREDLTLVHTQDEGVDRYEFVWTMAGELGQQIGRATILDDGRYHYVVSASIDASRIEEYQEVWNGIFESYHLIPY